MSVCLFFGAQNTDVIVKRSVVILILCPVLGACVVGSVFADTAGVLGLSSAQATSRLGKPELIYHPILDIDPSKTAPVYVYCVGGKYKPYYYDHMGNMVEETRYVPLSGNTYGPCGRNPGRAVTLLGRYESLRLVAVGYVGAHGALAYDYGWRQYIEHFIAGISASEIPRSIPVPQYHIKSVKSLGAASKYSNGVTLVDFEPEIGRVAFIFYSPGTTIDLAKEPITNVIKSLIVQFGR